MSPLYYCCLVQRHVLASRPDAGSPRLDRWAGDTGRASQAVMLALDGRSAAALRIAEQLAARYRLPDEVR